MSAKNHLSIFDPLGLILKLFITTCENEALRFSLSSPSLARIRTRDRWAMGPALIIL